MDREVDRLVPLVESFEEGLELPEESAGQGDFASLPQEDATVVQADFVRRWWSGGHNG